MPNPICQNQPHQAINSLEITTGIEFEINQLNYLSKEYRSQITKAHAFSSQMTDEQKIAFMQKLSIPMARVNSAVSIFKAHKSNLTSSSAERQNHYQHFLNDLFLALDEVLDLVDPTLKTTPARTSNTLSAFRLADAPLFFIKNNLDRLTSINEDIDDSTSHESLNVSVFNTLCPS